MQRTSIGPSHVVLKLLTLAISVVVGFQLGPRLGAHGATPAAIDYLDQKGCEDVARAGHRIEVRAFRAHLLDRLPPAHVSDGPSAVSLGAPDGAALAQNELDDRADIDRIPIVKYVPRMERGDPPRS